MCQEENDTSFSGEEKKLGKMPLPTMEGNAVKALRRTGPRSFAMRFWRSPLLSRRKFCLPSLHKVLEQ